MHIFYLRYSAWMHISYLRYSAWMHMPSWMSEVRAMREKMEVNATWYEKLTLSHSLPSYWIMQ
jgi:hypothetical protein